MDREALSVEEAAEALGVHYQTIYRRCRSGDLNASKEGKAWKIPADAIRDEKARIRGELEDFATAADCAEVLRVRMGRWYAEAMAEVTVQAEQLIEVADALEEDADAERGVRRRRADEWHERYNALRESMDQLEHLNAAQGIVRKLDSEAVSGARTVQRQPMEAERNGGEDQ